MMEEEEMTALYSHERAAELAATINAYWFDRGWETNARPFRIDADHWGVTSDLVNGNPTKRSCRVAA